MSRAGTLADWLEGFADGRLTFSEIELRDAAAELRRLRRLTNEQRREARVTTGHPATLVPPATGEP